MKTVATKKSRVALAYRGGGVREVPVVSGVNSDAAPCLDRWPVMGGDSTWRLDSSQSI